MRSQVSARIDPIVDCSADLPGSRPISTLAKRRAESESRSVELQAPVRLLAQMLEHRAAQHRLAAQAAAAAPRPRPRAEVGGDLGEQLRVRVQPRGRPLQLDGDGVVHGLRIE